MPDLAAALRDLVAANHILAHEGIVDAYGHISMRHPERPDRFFLAAGCSPETVTLDDIREYDLDCKPVVADGHTMYVERPIHAPSSNTGPTSIRSFIITRTKSFPIASPKR